MNSSKLRFLVDVGVGKGIEKYLRGEVINCVFSVSSVGSRWVLRTKRNKNKVC